MENLAVEYKPLPVALIDREPQVRFPVCYRSLVGSI